MMLGYKDFNKLHDIDDWLKDRYNPTIYPASVIRDDVISIETLTRTKYHVGVRHKEAYFRVWYWKK